MKERSIRSMTNNNQQIIHCPNCNASITVDELGEHVNANPNTKKQAIEEQFQLWEGFAYDHQIEIDNENESPRWDLNPRPKVSAPSLRDERGITKPSLCQLSY